MEETKNIDPEQPAENIPEEIISSEQKPLPKTEEQLSTLNLQPSDMEVHHHGHVHEKKKWKDYLFQFLMLFLAVTLGFFVENQREHYIENQRAKQMQVL